MVKEELLKEIGDSYKEFCKRQINCVECALSKHKLVYDDYNQPCEEVFGLLRVIKGLKEELKMIKLEA